MSITAAYATNDGVREFFCALAASPVLFALLAYFIWMFKDPNRLQSEEYQLAQQRILHATKEGDEFQTVDQTTDHSSISTVAISESDQPDEPLSQLTSLPSYATKGRS